MAIVLRNTKGSELTFAEMDGNFTDLDSRITATAGNIPTDVSQLTDTTNILSGGLSEVVDDTSPQLGGVLDTLGHEITTTVGALMLTPAAGGYLHLGNGATATHTVSMYDRYFFPAVTPNTGDVLTAGQNPAELVWAPAAGGGGGVALTDLSVTSLAPAGGGTLTYDNVTGVFDYTPPDLSGFATANNPTFSGTLTASASSTFQATATFQAVPVFEVGVIEEFDSLTSASGTVIHDCSSARLFSHSTMTADFTVNLTNIGLTAGQASMVTLVLHQGNTAYMPTALEIGGVAQTVVWQGNSQPSGTANGKNIVSFSIMYDGAAYTVLGQSVSYGGV